MSDTGHSTTTQGPSRYGRRLLAWAAIIAIAVSVVLFPASPAQAGSHGVYSAEELNFVAQLNHYRVMNGLEPLKISDKLSEVARRHNRDMADHDFFGHRTLTHESLWFPYYASPKERMDLTGYDSYYGSGEIIGAGQCEAGSLFDGFKASGHHRRIMLYEDFSVVGISLEVVSGSDSIYYWTVDFGAHEDSSARSFTTYQQDDPRIDYEGSWIGRAEDSFSGSSHYYLESAGSMTVRFNGTSLSWIAERSRDSGISKVTLDEGDPVYVDLYNRKSQPRRCVYSTGSLPEGDHTLVIEWTGTQNPKASGSLVNVDAFDVLGNLESGVVLADLCGFVRGLYLGLRDGQLQL